MSDWPLCLALREGAAAGATLPEPSEALEQALRRFCERARAEWPEVDVADGALLQFAFERLPPGAGPEALEAQHAGDLLLACGCLRAHPAAQRALEAHFLPQLRSRLAPLRLDPAALDEVLQVLRLRLLLGGPEGRPRIADYLGRGRLEAWLGVASLRIALNLRRGEHAATRGAALGDDLASALPTPDLGQLREQLREPFRAAFREAAAALEPRDLSLLRLHYLEGLSGDRLAAAHRVHRATVTRWLSSARQALLDQTLQRLGQRLQLGRDELESALRAVRSQLDLSLPSLLRDGPP